MELIFVAGSWGSGTTAVAGALDKLGVPTFGPHFKTRDERTKNSYELIPFRDMVLHFVDEASIQHKGNYTSGFKLELENFKNSLLKAKWPELPNPERKIFALKMPLATLCLPEICEIFDTKIILIHRPFDDIEESRLRRDWHPNFGGAGAYKIYQHFLANTITHKLSYLSISHNDFVTNTRDSMEKIIDYCDIGEFSHNIDKADEFVRKP
ncbi:sulfotransferase [Pseudemcibacter aquimaris]|uniref:sulfotransferase n=1 Tax=Pseudemcibacter aquimaris TaxID=2857064 RepID=UPI0020118EDB|nr:sulfotransferase [Pseudemcibacter aquimaris]MCC3860596.1 sulfotransferase [Pseudemcibacter aquimaris]WDU59417.1 sulfotransferase [Pseudemcibacter aquimaris]